VSHAKNKPQLIGGYTSINLGLVRDVALLARGLGIRCRISSFKYRGNQAWQLAFSTVDLVRWGGRGMRCQRKLAKFAGITCAENCAAAAKSDLVPFPQDVSEYVAPLLQGCYKTHAGMYGATRKAIEQNCLSRITARAIVNTIALPEDVPAVQEWKRIVADTSVTWEKVLNVDYTGIRETGYDLTVPGTETFANFDGVILSNTMSFTVPVTDQGVKEAVDKMMPERNLISERNWSAHYAPSNEYVKGLYLATKQPKRRATQVFDSIAAAKEAYRRGDIEIDDPIQIRD